MSFRRINDPGEIATMLTVLFPDEATTRKVAAALGTKTLADSGWHVYNNMEQILSWQDEPREDTQSGPHAETDRCHPVARHQPQRRALSIPESGRASESRSSPRMRRLRAWRKSS